MTTALATLVGSIVTVLSTATAVSSQIYRARMRPMAAQHTDAVVVRILSATPDRVELGGAPIDFTTLVAIECYARSATTTPDLAADTLLANVYAKLMADTSLGGTVMDINLTAIDYDFDADADNTACITLTLSVRHRTSSTTLT
jgi:hypothetical protein